MTTTIETLVRGTTAPNENAPNFIDQPAIRRKFASFIGTATTVGYDREMTGAEVLAAIEDYWKSPEGESRMQTLVRGAWRYAEERQLNAPQNTDVEVCSE